MYLLILETIGTQELILVGLVALIVFGPRKLPQMARKFGKMMTEFRKVSNEFRSTWEREVAFEDKKPPPGPYDAGEIAGALPANTIEQTESRPGSDAGADLLPKVEEVSTDDFEMPAVDVTAPSGAETETDTDTDTDTGTEPAESDKQNWL